MNLQSIWTSENPRTDDLVFSRKFKVYKGKNDESTKTVEDENCYGVLYYEKIAGNPIYENEAIYGNRFEGIYGIIEQVIGPYLSLHWAQVVIEMMEQGLFPAEYLSWADIEAELRKLGYEGRSLCPFYLPDTIGYSILCQIDDYAEYEFNEDSQQKGWIEMQLNRKGYRWQPELNTWINPEGEVWNVEKEEFDLVPNQSMRLPPANPRQNPSLNSR